MVEQHGEFLAWAGYDRWQNRPDVEVAFHVDEHHHGKGIATLLLEHLAVMARHNGFDRFTASTMADNRAMLAVFAKAGWPVHRRFDSGMIDVDFDLDDTAEFLDSVERREQRADSRAVAHLLLPSSIAVVGASDRPGSVGDAVELDQVLLVGGEGDTRVGAPLVDGAKVVGTITAQGRGPKITVFKMKRRKGYRRKQGHRQEYTELKIDKIEGRKGPRQPRAPQQPS